MDHHKEKVVFPQNNLVPREKKTVIAGNRSSNTQGQFVLLPFPLMWVKKLAKRDILASL